MSEQPTYTQQIRAMLGLIGAEVLAEALGFDSPDAFTAWCSELDKPPPSVVIDDTVFYPIQPVGKWLHDEYNRQNPIVENPVPNPAPASPPSPPADTQADPNNTREEFVPPPQRRDYSKERLPAMDEHNNKYEAARAEKERQAREQSH